MERVVFLDRDGTINEEVNYLHKKEDLHILPAVTEGLRLLREAGFLLILITNQAGIGRGYYSVRDCIELNDFLAAELQRGGARLSAGYYCPHHPTHGIGEWKRACLCRKPEAGLFYQAEWEMLSEKLREDCLFGLSEREREEAERELPPDQGGGESGSLLQSGLRLPEALLSELKKRNETLSELRSWLSHCYMIGDKRIDMEAGHRFGVCSILLSTGYGAEEKRKAKPGDYDYFSKDMKEAAEWILKRERRDSLKS